MEISTLTRTRATTLRSRALEAGRQGRTDLCRAAKPSFVAFRGGAIADMAAFAGMAAVIDGTVTNHLYSPRPGPPSCSPPV